MSKKFMSVGLLAGAFLALGHPAIAQEMVHALTGTVSAIDHSRNTITLFQDNGSKSTFNVKSSAKTRVSFDKRIEEQSTAADQFQKQGSYVILFYYGMNANRTAVAVESLGQGPFSSTKGKVADWNDHNNTLVVTDQDGKKHPFKVQTQTVAETYAGAVNGSDFHVDKGDRVRVVSAIRNGTPVALFVRAI